MRRPRPRRRFLGPPDELNYLNDIVRYQSDRQRLESDEAMAMLRRMRVLLDADGDDDGSITGPSISRRPHNSIGPRHVGNARAN